MAITPTANRISPIETKAPTLTSLVALDSRIGHLPAPAQEMPQSRLPGHLGFLDGPHEVHAALVQVGDPVADPEGAGDVVGHHDRGDLDASLKIADEIVDRVRRD